MSDMKKPSPLLLLAILLTSPANVLFPQGASMEGITSSSSFGITYGTMHSAFQKDLKFEIGVQMVVDAAVELLIGSVEEANRLSMNPKLFVDSVFDGVERSIRENSKRVDLQQREEEILYERVMAALREQIQLLGSSLATTEPTPPVAPPTPVVVQPEPSQGTDVEPPTPPVAKPKTPKAVIPRRTDGYYISTFTHFGRASDGEFSSPNGGISIDPGTTWGYGIAVGLNRSNDIRMEVEASWKGSSAKSSKAGANDLEISYYSLMVNAYKDFDAPFIDNLDLYTGLGLGWSVANLSGNVQKYSVFGNVPETGELAFAYQFMVGANYRVSERLSAILAYRLFNTGSYNGYSPSVVHFIELALRMDL
ncbi:MAG: porin family protein [Opitutae bacterium]|nr:porin family protein [Opitutae bacterium]